MMINEGRGARRMCARPAGFLLFVFNLFYI